MYSTTLYRKSLIILVSFNNASKNRRRSYQVYFGDCLQLLQKLLQSAPQPFDLGQRCANLWGLRNETIMMTKKNSKIV